MALTPQQHLEAIIRDGDACYEGCTEHAAAALEALNANRWAAFTTGELQALSSGQGNLIVGLDEELARRKAADGS